eukprot:gene9824-2146_t
MSTENANRNENNSDQKEKPNIGKLLEIDEKEILSDEKFDSNKKNNHGNEEAWDNPHSMTYLSRTWYVKEKPLNSFKHSSSVVEKGFVRG